MAEGSPAFESSRVFCKSKLRAPISVESRRRGHRSLRPSAGVPFHGDAGSVSFLSCTARSTRYYHPVRISSNIKNKDFKILLRQRYRRDLSRRDSFEGLDSFLLSFPFPGDKPRWFFLRCPPALTAASCSLSMAAVGRVRKLKKQQH